MSRNGPTGFTERRAAAFTFLEIVVVIVILGLFFGIAVPNFDGLTPKYRLRTGARRLGSKVEGHRLAAITRGAWLGVKYVMDGEQSWYELVRPPPDEFPNQPVSERITYGREELPQGVHIRSVRLRGSGQQYDTGTVLVLFSPAGTTGSHIVTLVNDRGRSWTVKLNAITGTVDYESGDAAGFDDFRG